MSRPGLVIVGASLAGVRAGEAARRAGYSGVVTIVDGDAAEPYDRPPLSKKFLTDTGMESPPALLKTEAAARLDLQVRLGDTASALDPVNRTVHFESSSIEYDRLVIAAGCAARPLQIPGSTDPGVHYLRHLKRAMGLRDALVDAKRVVIVGGGFIGIEVASSLLLMGKHVSMVEREPSLLGVLGPDLSRWITERFVERGGDLNLGAQVVGLAAQDRLRRVTLAGGHCIEADVVIVGVGAVPQVEWLAGSGIALDDGVVCSPQLETSLPGVFAAGDVARWHSKRLGRLIRVEHWSNAVMQGIVAGSNAAATADSVDFDEVPYFWSDFFDARVQVAGDLTRWDEHRVAVEDEAGVVHIYGSEGNIVAVAARDAQRDFAKQRRRIGTPID